MTQEPTPQETSAALSEKIRADNGLVLNETQKEALRQVAEELKESEES